MQTQAAGKNIDPSEVAKFEALASRWWDQNSEFRPLHQINPLRLNYIDQRSPVAGKKVLDVGCGGGILSEGLAARGAIVTGIDVGEAPLSVAELHKKESGFDIEYRLTTIEELAEQEPENYDIIACMEMLEHVPDPSSIIKACSKALKPGGMIYFSTISRNPKAYLFAIVAAERVLKLLPKGTHDYEKLIKPSELARWARQADLQPKDISGMTYNPLTKRYRLSSDTSVNYLVHAHKPL
ncbi:MAG: bifunctional 2-polyprenyl-6-hydroxyphenol methylase/3-demethylubiquinol 3-O-methyltransferase UbiG [Pseudomonadales bacterium]|nr:bifunctional 2-polyprenyl-6-hydroxyphenol methylase/3-demethylubiquinol 3-O-methyltransferase UbiG [Pseudomonadales bacterium]